MSDRDGLAALIRDSDKGLEAMECLNDHDVEVLVDAILAAGWESPRERYLNRGYGA